MNTRLGTAVFLLVFVLMMGSGLAVARGPASKAAKATATSAAKSQVTALVEPKPIGIDPDKVYKAHCSSCHVEPRRFSDRANVTIIRHMRVRANLTAEEEKAIIRYLSR